MFSFDNRHEIAYLFPVLVCLDQAIGLAGEALSMRRASLLGNAGYCISVGEIENI